MNWRYVRAKQMSCIGCGAPQRGLDDNRHFNWCQIPTEPEDGPKTRIRVADVVQPSD